MVGSLVVNGALVALLVAIAPRVFDRPLAAPAVLDVSIEPPPVPPPATAPPVIEPAASISPVAETRHARAPRGAPPPSMTLEQAPVAVDDPATTSTGGSGDAGSGAGDGSGGAGDGTGADSPAGVAATMPIPLGSRNAQLPYTREALVARTEGNVLVRVLVGADGKVSEATLARGLGHGLDAIALALAAKLEFQPARDALGHPTTARITWRFHFTPPPNAASL